MTETVEEKIGASKDVNNEIELKAKLDPSNVIAAYSKDAR